MQLRIVRLASQQEVGAPDRGCVSRLRCAQNVFSQSRRLPLVSQFADNRDILIRQKHLTNNKNSS